jgi:hypothetical protein
MLEVSGMLISPIAWMIVWYCRWKYRRGPVGLWETYYGGGEDMAHGTSVEFLVDGSGMCEYRGIDLMVTPFKWRIVEARCIELQTADADGWVRVTYDFRTGSTEYGNRLILLYEKNSLGKCHYFFTEPLARQPL